MATGEPGGMTSTGTSRFVLVLAGGPDTEHPVSLQSAASVSAALRGAGHRVHEAVIDRLDEVALAALPGDVVFPVLHGPWGEGGPLQVLLETHGRPFVGSGAAAAEAAMDKMVTKRAAQDTGLAVPEGEALPMGAPCPLEPPLVIKPLDEGSSVGVRLCRTDDEVAEARRDLHPRYARLMVERLVEGRELTVGLLCETVLPIIEIVPPKGTFYDWGAKYEHPATRFLVEPDLSADIRATCEEASIRIAEALGCRDVARIDFLVDGDTPLLLEVNTMPGFTDHSLVPMAAAHAGCPMPALCTRLVETAMARG